MKKESEQVKIPKKIHYCWFGGNELPEFEAKCIESWKKYCSDYEIICWNENNVDLNENDFIKEAYQAKKWAFVADYVRLKVLYQYGGIYMDTDVEVCKSLDEYLSNQAFFGFEKKDCVSTGIIASVKEHTLFSELLEYYKKSHFLQEDGSYDMTTNVVIITKILTKHGLKLDNTQQDIYGIRFYPSDYFCPKDFSTGIVDMTERTACIHHFSSSWMNKREKKDVEARQFCYKHFGRGALNMYRIYVYVLHPGNLVKKIKSCFKK